MKPTFIHSLVNDPFEDPSLFLRIMRERRALLFDVGNISRLSPGDLQKITDVFVTHMHIDHFIGLDTLIRALLRRQTALRVYGPSNIADCVEGKLKGYTWNLIRDYPLKIEVICIKGDKMISSDFAAIRNFERREHGVSEFDEIILKEPLFTVKALQLDHQVPCLAFSIEEEFHININKASLREKELPVGPWLSELKKAIREKKPGDLEFMIGHRRHSLDELLEIVKITEGQKVSYVTDVSITEANIDKITEFVRGSHAFYCEAYFLDKDREKALQRFHLTAKTAGKIARQADVKHLVVMHFSPRYRNTPDSPADEAMEEFKPQSF